MAQRSRKRRRPPAATAAPGKAAPGAEPAAAPARPDRYARSRARDDAVRASLQPLAPGERPLVVKISAALAMLIAVGNLALYLAGTEIQGQEPKLAGTLALCAVLAAAAVGMWRMKYWAVLGFQVLLGVTIVFASLSLLVASNVEAGLRAVAVVLVAGALFWFLIRAMARIQMPDRA